jgi:hypothetical protein
MYYSGVYTVLAAGGGWLGRLAAPDDSALLHLPGGHHREVLQHAHAVEDPLAA